MHLRLIVLAFVLVPLFVGFAAAGDPPPASPPAAPFAAPSLVPKPSAPQLRPFTLEDRYLDAARRGDVAAMKLCLDKGVALAAKDLTGLDAMHFAVRDARSVEAARFLHEKGLPVDEPDGMGRTPLMEAAAGGDVAMISWLLEQKAVFTKHDVQGQTALYNAALGGHLDAVRHLVEAGAPVDARDNYQDTPLMGVCAKGNDEMARLLVEKGADPSLRDQEGRLAKDRAHDGSSYCSSLPDRKPAPALAAPAAAH